MTLSFEEKKAIFDDYKELTAVPVSMNRINYHFNASAVDHKIAVRFLHPNGNAFIYAGYLPKEETTIKAIFPYWKATKAQSVSCWKRRFPF